MAFIMIPNRFDRETRKEVRAISRSNEALVKEVMYLEKELDRLTLITQAVWELVQSKTGLEDADLEDLVEEIDLRDGKLDGKITPQPQTCNDCGRTKSVRTQMCFFCGHVTGAPSA